MIRLSLASFTSGNLQVMWVTAWYYQLPFHLLTHLDIGFRGFASLWCHFPKKDHQDFL